MRGRGRFGSVQVMCAPIPRSCCCCKHKIKRQIQTQVVVIPHNVDEQRVPGLTALKGSVPTITSVYAEIFGFSYLFNVVDYGGEQVLPVDVIDVCYIHLCERTDFHKVIHTVIKFHLSSTVFDIIAKKKQTMY